MKEVHWGEAFNAASKYTESDKVLLVVFSDPDCDVCNHIIPYIEAYSEEHPEDYEVMIVKDYKGFPFPPLTTPIAYAFIPNCPDEMPLSRMGAAPPDAIKNDIEKQIRCMKEGLSYKKVSEEWQS